MYSSWLRLGWWTRLIVVLLLVSVFFFGLNYLVFANASFMFNLVTLQLAFLPINVIIITVILNRLIAARDRRARMEKLNIVIGVFFDEIGTPLLSRMVNLDPAVGSLRDALALKPNWKPQDFDRAAVAIGDHKSKLEMDKGVLEELRDLLRGKRNLLLRLLENPTLLEHERFTDLLNAITHLYRELDARGDLRAIPPADNIHLIVDVRRCYVAILPQWLAHMRRLQTSHPYLYSLEVRTNPFDPTTRVEITQASEET